MTTALVTLFIFVVQQCLVPIQLRKQIVDKNVLLKRCYEELHLLVDEMKAYTKFYYGKLRAQERDVTDIENGIAGIFMIQQPLKQIAV